MTDSSLSPTRAGRLLTEGLVSPFGVGRTDPLLSWEIEAAAGEVVLGYRVQVARSAAELAGDTALPGDTALLWDTGDVLSTQHAVVYAGTCLRSRDRLAWRVRPVLQDAVASWSEVAFAELGLLATDDWTASWVTHPLWTLAEPPTAAPIVGTTFAIDRPVASARLYVSGLGVYVAEIDGAPVDSAVLEPGSSDFRRRVAARALDVTDRLEVGSHGLTLRLGEGSSHVRPIAGRYSKFTGRSKAPAALAQLEIEYADGTRQVIASDEDWRAKSTATVLTHWYGGEDFDGSATVGTDPDAGWTEVAVVESVEHGPDPWWRSSPPVTAQETIAAVSVAIIESTADSASVLLDFGSNIAGWPRLSVSDAVPEGSVLVLRPSELVGAHGHVDQSTGGSPIFDRYTVGAAGDRSWHPEFCYHGFRYLEISGPPAIASPDALQAHVTVLHVDDAPAGTFDSSDAGLKRLHDLIGRAVKSNLFTMPTDCPHREKLGWLEQLHLVFGPLSHLFDVRAHFQDVVTNILDAQTVEGMIPDIAPELTVFEGGFRSDVNWGGAVLEIPWRLYQEYGDARTLARAWEAGVRYLDYLAVEADGGLLADHGLGDWITLDDSTPRALVAGYGYIRALETAVRIAEVRGEPGGAARFATLARDHRSLLESRFVDARTGSCGSDSQGSYALAIDLGLVAGETARAATARLLALLRRDGYFTVGEVALPSLLRVLAGDGQHELIGSLVRQTENPGYGQMIDSDLTALAESWDNRDHPNSANHFMLGAIGDWLVGDVAGLRQATGSIGWQQVVVAPVLLDGVESAGATHHSRFGDTSVAWLRAADTLTVTVAIPVGSTASIRIPRLPGHAATTTAPGDLLMEAGYFVMAVTHGTWTIETCRVLVDA
ncbi:family 78 glycoside hydrolase catalytic domain [Lacisediminihabitans sp. FW035]